MTEQYMGFANIEGFLKVGRKAYALAEIYSNEEGDNLSIDAKVELVSFNLFRGNKNNKEEFEKYQNLTEKLRSYSLVLKVNASGSLSFEPKLI